MSDLGQRRRRRWLGRRRSETSTEPPDDFVESAEPEPDWNSVITDSETTSTEWPDWPGHEASSPDPGGAGDTKEVAWSEWAPAPSGIESGPPQVGEEATPTPLVADEAVETAGPPTETTDGSDPTEVSDAVEVSDGVQVSDPVEVSEDTGAATASDATDVAEVAEQPMPSPEAGGPAERGEELSVAIGEPLSGPAVDANGSAPGSSTEGAAVSTPADAPVASEAPPEEERRYRTTPSWPPPRKPRIGLGILSLAVLVIMVALLVTNGQIGADRDESEPDLESLPALQTNPDSVPRDWIVYRHPTGGFGISYPPDWTVRDDGTAVEIRNPSSRAHLRIDQRRPPGKTSPEDEWLEQERALSTRSVGYRRLQLSEATYQGHLAALWEYTFAEGNVGIHAADLQFITKKDRFTLHFRGPVTEWQALLPNFQGFLSSFKPPK